VNRVWTGGTRPCARGVGRFRQQFPDPALLILSLIGFVFLAAVQLVHASGTTATVVAGVGAILVPAGVLLARTWPDITKLTLGTRIELVKADRVRSCLAGPEDRAYCEAHAGELVGAAIAESIVGTALSSLNAYCHLVTSEYRMYFLMCAMVRNAIARDRSVGHRAFVVLRNAGFGVDDTARIMGVSKATAEEGMR